MSRKSNGVAGIFDGDGGGGVIRHTTAASPAAVLLNEELHSNRIFLLDTIYTTAGLTVRLPRATGTGNKYTVWNNAVQTVSCLVTVTSLDTMVGPAIMMEAVGGTDDTVFYASGTSDTITMNATTTGGLSGDLIEAIDARAGIWLVRLMLFPSGDTVTPFSATIS